MGVLLMSACASTPAPTPSEGAAAAAAHPSDPWERWNRQVFAFNDTVDEAVLKPVAKGYIWLTPEGLRQGVSHFFGNVGDAWSGVNQVLQGRLPSAGHSFARFGVNSVLGIFGVFDVATDMGLPREKSDFGHTLAVWGASSGPYVVLPFLGPSTLRDSLALPLDMKASPTLWVKNNDAATGMTGLRLVNTRAELLWATRLLGDVALDRYAFTRDGFLQRRREQTGEKAVEAEEERYDLP
jgi:phospholipid-binding lipoprotein MlaA